MEKIKATHIWSQPDPVLILNCYWREFPVEILRPKTLSGYKNIKGKGVGNLQHEYTAKTPLSYIVLSTYRTSKRPSFVPGSGN